MILSVIVIFAIVMITCVFGIKMGASREEVALCFLGTVTGLLLMIIFS